MWHVSCKNCGTFDIVGPWHPATTYSPDPSDPGNQDKGQHVITDRAAVRHSHDDDCQPGEEGHYPLAFTFMGAIGTPAPGGN